MLTDAQKKLLHKRLLKAGNTYHNEYMRIWRKARRFEAINFLGGKCKHCGSKNHLEFDHIKRQDKTIKSNMLLTSSNKVFWAEIRKCQLLCHRCHRIKTIAEELEIAAEEALHNTPLLTDLL